MKNFFILFNIVLSLALITDANSKSAQKNSFKNEKFFYEVLNANLSKLKNAGITKTGNKFFKNNIEITPQNPQQVSIFFCHMGGGVVNYGSTPPICMGGTYNLEWIDTK